jgi:hypothetical protein
MAKLMMLNFNNNAGFVSTHNASTNARLIFPIFEACQQARSFDRKSGLKRSPSTHVGTGT